MENITIYVTPSITQVTAKVLTGGIPGPRGLQGIDGKTAYEVAVINGFVGSEPEWLLSLEGKNAYQLAVLNGYIGTLPEWIASLKGEQGDAFVYANFTPEQLALLKGEKGDAFVYSDFTVEQLALLKGATPIAEWAGTSLGFDGGAKVDLKGEQGVQGSSLKVPSFINQSYPIVDSQVNHLGKDWYNNAPTSIGDIPGTSSKWVERLGGYASILKVAELSKYSDLWGYNLDHLNGLSEILSTPNSIKSIVLLGDSITEGQVSTEPFRINGYAGRLEAMLKSLYGNGGKGIIPFWRYKNSSTLEISINGTNSLSQYFRLLTGASYSFNDADGTATGADLIYEKFNGGGKIQFGKSSIYVSVQTSQATEQIATLTLSGITPSVSTINGWIEDAPVRLVGITINQSSITNGLRFHNLGFTAKTGADWLNPAVNGDKIEQITALLNPKFEIISLGANDYNTQTVVATYKSSVKDAVNKALARNSKVLLVINGLWDYEIPTDPKTIKHLTYEKAMYEIANECNVALCDFNAKWRAFGKNKFLSFLQDATIHPNDKGHIDLAYSIMACLYNR